MSIINNYKSLLLLAMLSIAFLSCSDPSKEVSQQEVSATKNLGHLPLRKQVKEQIVKLDSLQKETDKRVKAMDSLDFN